MAGCGRIDPNLRDLLPTGLHFVTIGHKDEILIVGGLILHCVELVKPIELGVSIRKRAVCLWHITCKIISRKIQRWTRAISSR